VLGVDDLLVPQQRHPRGADDQQDQPEHERRPAVGPECVRHTTSGYFPTNARRAGHGYLTVAVGRDYGDVSPTSGTFEADYPGRLSSSKRVGVAAVEYGLSRG
jgi:hypothetical protein